MTQDIEQQLRSYFGHQADSVRVPPVPMASLRSRIGRDRFRRGATASLATACALALAAGAWTIGIPEVSTTTAAQSRTWSIKTLPTAGDLAQDAEWKRQAIDRLKALSPQPAINNVIFAGRLPVGAALIAAQEQLSGPMSQGTAEGGSSEQVRYEERQTLAVLYSPTGDPADLQMREYSMPGQRIWSGNKSDPGSVSLAVEGQNGHRYFVVIPLSSVGQVEVSAGPRIAPDGSTQRSWMSVPVRKGAATGTLEDVEVNLPQSRVDKRVEAFEYSEALAGVEERAKDVKELLRSWPRTVKRPTTQTAIALLTGPLSVIRRKDLTVEPLYSDDTGRQGRAIVSVAVRLRGGGTFQTLAIVLSDAMSMSRQSYGRGWAVPSEKAHTTPTAWIDNYPGTASRVDLRVRVLQPGAVRVVLKDSTPDRCASGGSLGSALPDERGVATILVTVPSSCRKRVQDPVWSQTVDYSGLTVTAFDAEGAQIGTSPIMTTNGDIRLFTSLSEDALTPALGD
ncbi:MAG: hypothetical protein QG608_50 [Actinomycetota bacterium]|nr:hypothetical protein [Actinomycetota bacterium]